MSARRLEKLAVQVADAAVSARYWLSQICGVCNSDFPPSHVPCICKEQREARFAFEAAVSEYEKAKVEGL